jgi:hypothetical protein
MKLIALSAEHFPSLLHQHIHSIHHHNANLEEGQGM